MDISSLSPLAQEMYLTQPPIFEVIMHWRLVYSANRKASERIFELTNRCAGDGVKLGDLEDRAHALEKQYPGMESIGRARLRWWRRGLGWRTSGKRRSGMGGLSSILPVVQGWMRGAMGS